MHDKSHIVYRLVLHLPCERQVYYRERNQKRAAVLTEERDTHLTASLKLDQLDENAQKFHYCTIPEHYVFSKQTTKKTLC